MHKKYQKEEFFMIEGKISFFDKNKMCFVKQTSNKLETDDFSIKERQGKMLFCEGDESIDEIDKRNSKSREELSALNVEKQNVDENVQGSQQTRMRFVCGEGTPSSAQIQNTMKFMQGDEDLQDRREEELQHSFWTDKISDKIEQNEVGRMQFRHEYKPKNKNVAESCLYADLRRNNSVSRRNVAENSVNLYNQFLVLQGLYKSLQNFAKDVEIQNEISQMLHELELVTYGMENICQMLAKDKYISRQIQQTPHIHDYCGGLVTTQNFVHQILWDIRDLLRMVENDNVQIQLLIIYTTLSSQQDDLRDFYKAC